MVFPCSEEEKVKKFLSKLITEIDREYFKKKPSLK
jgi:hypothetical protein